ncbi:MAG: SBBP repeat-containing protein [Ignavibacteria bacterium]
MKIIYSLVTYFVILFNGSAYIHSQVNQDWVARYNGTGNRNDVAQSVAADNSGNVYVTGWSTNNLQYTEYTTIKYNSSGVQQWLQKYHGSFADSSDFAYALAIDGAGNVYVTGKSFGLGTYYDFATVKYNSSGVQQWVARYNGPGNRNDAATRICVDGLENVYVTGYSFGAGSDNDYTTIKYNSSGAQQWVQRYDGPDNGADAATSIGVDNSGNVYVTGGSSNINGSQYTTIKYNAAGFQQWVQRYNNGYGGNDGATDLVIDGSGYVYVTGASWNGYNRDIVTIKYSFSGVQQWASRYNGYVNFDDVPSSIAIDNSGNVYVAGWSTSIFSYADFATIKYNSSGDSLWVRRYYENGYSNGAITSMAVDNSGNVYVTGYCSGANNLYNNYVTIKYSTSGVEQWLQMYNGPADSIDIPYSLAVDGSGNVYVTGQSTGIGTLSDFATIKYSQSIGIKKISSAIPGEFNLSQNYPNPFNPNTTIEFAIPKSSDVKLVVYDISGREADVLINEKLRAGSYKVDFYGSKLSSGVYFYKLTSEDFIQTKRMVLVK